MKFNCGNCGQIDCVIVDGYGHGDRLLEGVTFEVRRDDDGKYHAQVEEFSRDYFARFNQQPYLGKIEAGMDNEEFAICPRCGEEVLINKIEPRSVLSLVEDIVTAIGCVGTAVAAVVEDVGDETFHDLDEKEEQRESSSTEGGDSGGGGASEDLGEPSELEKEEAAEAEEAAAAHDDEEREEEESEGDEGEQEDDDDSSDDSSDDES